MGRAPIDTFSIRLLFPRFLFAWVALHAQVRVLLLDKPNSENWPLWPPPTGSPPWYEAGPSRRPLCSRFLCAMGSCGQMGSRPGAADPELSLCLCAPCRQTSNWLQEALPKSAKSSKKAKNARTFFFSYSGISGGRLLGFFPNDGSGRVS
jgi:hypothetical protein